MLAAACRLYCHVSALLEAMAKGGRLTDFVKGQLWTYHLAKVSNREIARKLRIGENSVRYNIRKMSMVGSMTNVPASGRPRGSTRRDDRLLKMECLKARFAPARVHAKTLELRTGTTLSERTVRRRLQEFGLMARVAKRAPLLTKTHKTARLVWARQHRHWTVEDWQRVFFTDESKFTVYGNCKRRAYVRRRSFEAYADACLLRTVKFGAGSVMVWGGFAAGGVGALHRVEGTMNKEGYLRILNDVAVPSAMGLLGSNFIYQQDNDPKHTAKVVLRFLDGSPHFTRLQWPSQSPDLNPIEHLWDEVQRRLRALTGNVKSQSELWDRLQEVWRTVPPDVTLKLVQSMPARIAEVIANGGGATSY